MSQIKDAQSEIEDLKISIDDAVVIHAFNNLSSSFHPYLMILNHKTRQKAQLLILFKFIKSLEDKKLRLKNESTANTNFVQKAKSKLANHGNYIHTGKKSIMDSE